MKRLSFLSIMLNIFPSMSLSIGSTVKQKVDRINSLLTYVYVTCIFAEWPLDFYHAAGILWPCIIYVYLNNKNQSLR